MEPYVIDINEKPETKLELEGALVGWVGNTVYTTDRGREFILVGLADACSSEKYDEWVASQDSDIMEEKWNAMLTVRFFLDRNMKRPEAGDKVDVRVRVPRTEDGQHYTTKRGEVFFNTSITRVISTAKKLQRGVTTTTMVEVGEK